MVTLGKADLILVNGQFHTVDRENPVAEAVAVRDGKFLEVGTVAEVMQHHCDGTKRGRLKKATPPSRPERLAPAPDPRRPELQPRAALGRRAVPGRRPADAKRAGPAHAVAPVGAQLVGGWSEFQFAERRMPTLDEIKRRRA